MKLENQVVSLELEKKMKELGFKQESIWFWQEYKSGGGCIYLLPKKEVKGFIGKTEVCDYYSAYTVAELGEMLPIGIVMTKYEFNKGGEIRWACAYNDENIGNRICDDTLANCLARMLIWLRGKKII